MLKNRTSFDLALLHHAGKAIEWLSAIALGAEEERPLSAYVAVKVCKALWAYSDAHAPNRYGDSPMPTSRYELVTELRGAYWIIQEARPEAVELDALARFLGQPVTETREDGMREAFPGPAGDGYGGP